jgi:menaquinone reductase, multiheme cytochrome c subunit
MEKKTEKKGKTKGKWLSFVLGVLASLVVGWVVFPELIHSTKKQPVRFSHLKHGEEATLKCQDCHTFRDDGSFAGIPTLAKCMECHGSPEITEQEQDFIKRGIAWHIYSKQPDHVYFSHIAHIKIAKLECTGCHKSVGGKTDINPPYRYRWISGYAPEVMSMETCEACHEKKGTSNACFVCHK